MDRSRAAAMMAAIGPGISAPEPRNARPTVTPLALILLVLAALWGMRVLAGRNGLVDAFRATLATPALLVPATMAVVGCVVVAAWNPNATLHENPFGLVHARSLGRGIGLNWLVFAIVTLALAGHVGVLQAWRTGRRPFGIAFFRGILDHTPTFALGKLGAFGATWLISHLGAGSLLSVIYIVPSVLLAPLVATAAEYPRQPLLAIAAALRTTHARFEVVGNLVFAQVVFLVGTFYVGDRLWSGQATFDLLTFSSGTLSYNTFPFALVFTPGLSLTLVVVNALASSVFLAGYFQRLGSVDHAASDATPAAERA